MRYFDEMLDKFGFNDGESEPCDARKAREVYVEVVNELAKRFGSGFEAAAYDRPGCHNGCMILFNPRGDADRGSGHADGAMWDAIDAAKELELDQFVKSFSRVRHEALKKFLASNTFLSVRREPG